MRSGYVARPIRSTRHGHRAPSLGVDVRIGPRTETVDIVHTTDSAISGTEKYPEIGAAVEIAVLGHKTAMKGDTPGKPLFSLRESDLETSTGSDQFTTRGTMGACSADSGRFARCAR